MNTEHITIEDQQVVIHTPANRIWLNDYEIASLFGVFTSAVGSNIRSIFKNEILREERVCRRQELKNNNFIILYNLEMITALAFRLKSHQAQVFRRWIVERASNPVILWKIPNMDTTLN